ncbi:MAG: MAPEG family protein [Bosea sp. (in: a-proteobacteria)]
MEHIVPHVAAAALYVGLLILFGVVLQVRVIRLRRSKLIGLGDGQDKDLSRAIRVHGNFAESMPFALAGLIMLALVDTQVILIHGIGIMLVVGRVLHAVGLSRSSGSSFGRVAGMAMTFTALTVMALALVLLAIPR